MSALQASVATSAAPCRPRSSTHSRLAAHRHVVCAPRVSTACPRQSLQQQHVSGAVISRRRQLKTAAVGDAMATFAEVIVEEVMNPKPVVLRSSQSLKEAVHVMLDANVAGAPVVDDAGQLVGVLSEADLIIKGAGRPDEHFLIPPIYLGIVDSYVMLRDNKAIQTELTKMSARTVADAMVAKDAVVSVTPATPMNEAAQLMLHHDINLLPVVENQKQVVGVLTRHDVLRGIYAAGKI